MGLTSIWRELGHDLSESRKSGPPPIRVVGDRGRMWLSRVFAKWDWSLTSGFRSEEDLCAILSSWTHACMSTHVCSYTITPMCDMGVVMVCSLLVQ